MKKVKLVKKKEALLQYEKERNDIYERLGKVRTSKQVDKLMKEWEEAINKVREAFLEDTSHINTWSHVGVMSIADIAEMYFRSLTTKQLNKIYNKKENLPVEVYLNALKRVQFKAIKDSL